MSVLKRKRKGVESETYWYKFEHAGKQIYRNSGQTTKEAAQAIETRVRRELTAGRIPGILAQISSSRAHLTAGLVEAYLAAGCPDRRLRARAGATLDEHRRLLANVKAWFGEKDPAQLTQADCDDYWQCRRAAIAARDHGNARQGGDRAVELELQTLANCLAWAVRARKLDRNPLTIRARYTDAKAIRHARDCMPSNADELHTLAGRLLQDPRSEANGWLYLLEALTGLRTIEARSLRADAQRVGLTCQPGYMDATHLHVARAKGGCNPRIRLDDPERPYIRPLLEHIAAWRAVRYPQSPWLIPGRSGAQLGEGSLSHVLADVVQELGLRDRAGQPLTRTSHGARAYYTSVRLSQGQEPDTVARELGQRSGEDLVRNTYGVDPDSLGADYWGSLKAVFTWTPTDGKILPAWEVWARRPEAENIVPMAMAMAG